MFLRRWLPTGCGWNFLLRPGGPERGGDHAPATAARRTLNALTNIYECRDGRWFMLALVNEDKEAPLLFKAVEREDLLADPRFADTAARRANAKALITVLDEMFAGKDWDNWRDVMETHGITFGRVGRLADLADDEQLRYAEAVIPWGEDGLTINTPLFIEGEVKRPPAPAPEVGEHSREVLAEIGYSAEEIAALVAGGAVRAG